MASAGFQVAPTNVVRFSNFFSCVSFPIYFQILSCSSLLQFARVSMSLQAPVNLTLETEVASFVREPDKSNYKAQ